MTHKYGEFTENQVKKAKKIAQSRIFFLLLVVENKDHQYDEINVNEVFDIEMRKIAGLNSLLLYSPQLVQVLMLLEAAYLELNSENYDWKKYRKLILDAGHEVDKIEEV